MADSPPPAPRGPQAGSTVCEGCQKPFPADYRFCPYCARTVRPHDAPLDAHLGMGLPGRFNWKLILVAALVLSALAGWGIWRVSQIPVDVEADPSPRPAQTTVEERFAADIAKWGYSVVFKGTDRVVVLVPRERWAELAEQNRFARHTLMADFRRALASQQRDRNDETPYRIEVRDPATQDLLAEETDFNLKVYD